MSSLPVNFPSSRSSKPTLAGALHVPDGDGPFPGAVVCHPHPAGGGTMDVFLVLSIARELARRGVAALRFDFAGVGESGGDFSDGAHEADDVKGACERLTSEEGVDGGRIGLTGWSFGAWMSLVALAQGAPASSLVAVAPPLSLYEWPSEVDAVRASAARRHYVLGEKDQFCPVALLQEFAGAVSPEDLAEVHILRRADHFLFTREAEVAGLVSDLLLKDI